ncbi:MAG TPA: Na+/H+ antiporter NhaC family protein, partial [Brumimicrobium sp.]|nr:Na+/H+ antiporter NhaC family protein [Brumimicrobium sp.]
MLKDIPTEVSVVADESVDAILLNGDTLALRRVGDEAFVKITLKDDVIQFQEASIQYNQPIVIPGWLSVLPPLIAIGLALIFKEVISSLFVGIFVGAATYGFYTGGMTGIFTALFTVLDHYILNALLDRGHISVILFSILIGSIVAIISKNGGMQGVVNHIIKYATTRRSGMLATYSLGLAIFFDDYANSLVVGNTMRPITDKLKISREKLAYIVDSTAAPAAAVAFITTWIGAELTYISDGIDKIETLHNTEIPLSAYGVFLNSLPYSFYSFFALIFMFILLYKQRDFGPMYKAELKALKGKPLENNVTNRVLEDFNPDSSIRVKAYNAIIPIFIIVFGTVASLFVTGLSATKAELLLNGVDVSNGTWAAIGTGEGSDVGFMRKLGVLIGNADSYLALLWASLAGLIVAVFLTVSQRLMTLKETMDSVLVGVNTMMPAMTILIFAWALSDVTSALNTAEYLGSFFTDSFEMVWIIPAISFILSALIAFSTGSSWSTMAMVYPLIIPLSFSVALNDPNYSEMAIMYNSIASVLAGAVLGDHCSPISDTTILSSLATSCDHISHVNTQMPYALTVAGVSLFIGVIPGAIGVPNFVSYIIGVIVLFLIIRFFGKKMP